VGDGAEFFRIKYYGIPDASGGRVSEPDGMPWLRFSDRDKTGGEAEEEQNDKH
jgi:hypothetical protein